MITRLLDMLSSKSLLDSCSHNVLSTKCQVLC